IDGSSDCPDSQLAAASHGNHDGQVSSTEVSDFTDVLTVGIQTTDQYKQFRNYVKSFIKIDDQPATSISVTSIKIDGAGGSTDSTDDIRLSATVTGSYGTVNPANTHKVWMQRTSSNLTVADRFVVQTGKNWRIVGDSVQPDSMQQFLSKGR